MVLCSCLLMGKSATLSMKSDFYMIESTCVFLCICVNVDLFCNDLAQEICLSICPEYRKHASIDLSTCRSFILWFIMRNMNQSIYIHLLLDALCNALSQGSLSIHLFVNLVFNSRIKGNIHLYLCIKFLYATDHYRKWIYIFLRGNAWLSRHIPILELIYFYPLLPFFFFFTPAFELLLLV